MLEGQNILCFAPDPWGDIWRNRHRLLSVLARQNRVLYVEPRTKLRKLVRRLRDGEHSLGDFFRPRVEEVRENLFVYHDPLHLPRTEKPVIGPFVEWRRDRLLAQAMRRLGFSRPILWLVRPNSWDLPGKFDEKAVLYQIVDDYLSFPGMRPELQETARKREEYLARRADVVIVTSRTLLEAKSGLHSNLHVVPNAVDEATLKAGLELEGPRATELENVGSPVVGYIGGLTGKVDLALLEDVAIRLRQELGGTLALVGPVRVSSAEDEAIIRRLEGLPQVVLCGQKEAAEMPKFLRAMDVCLVPYRLGDQAQAIDPLKLYEYLAFGKPTVSVDIPSVRPFEDVVDIAPGRAEFVRAVLDAASRKTDSEAELALAAKRRECAIENTWEVRVETISGLLEDVLAAPVNDTP